MSLKYITFYYALAATEFYSIDPFKSIRSLSLDCPSLTPNNKHFYSRKKEQRKGFLKAPVAISVIVK